MYDENEEDEEKVVKQDPMPPNKIRFTDLSEKLAEKAIRLTAKAIVGKKLDKDIATEIHKQINLDADLQDECAGWHIIVGKSYASAITY